MVRGSKQVRYRPIVSPSKLVFAVVICFSFISLVTLHHVHQIVEQKSAGESNPVVPAYDTTTASSRVSISSLLPINPNMGMHSLLPLLMDIITKKRKGRLIDLGAGVRDDDPCFPFIDSGWEGLLVDGDPTQTKKWAQRFPNKSTKDNVVAYILADTLPNLLKQHGYDSGVDLLKIDIDSFDCYVMKKVINLVRPPVIVMEVNVKFPPHIRMAMIPGYTSVSEGSHQIQFDSEKRGHVYGCSLSYQIMDLMRPNNYELLHLDWNNAIYVDTRKVDLPNNFPKPVEEIYENGYWSKPSRTKAFSFNNEVIGWQKMSMEEIFLDLQRRFQRDRSHQNHHIYIGHSTDGALTHACFETETGKLAKDNTQDAKCTAIGSSTWH